MATVFDVANYLLKSIGKMTAMKLQKLCYYCQVWSLVWDGQPLFTDDFEAWANGPVCRALYDEHRGEYSISEERFENLCSDYQFTEEERETMNAVIDYYGEKEPYWLSELTHKERPWLDARKGYAPGDICDEIISKDSMINYYGALVSDE